MQIDTLRFGLVEIDEKKAIDFGEGIPGLEQYHKYSLLQFEDSYPIVWLQSVEDRGICLPVIDTFVVLPDYIFDMDDTDAAYLELKSPDDIHVVNVVVIPEDIKGMTVNLAAPIIINTRTGKAKQIMLTGVEYNVRVPVFQELCKAVNASSTDASGEEGNADAGSL